MSVTAKFMVARKVPLGVVYDAEKGEWTRLGAREGDAPEPYAWELELTPDYAQGRNADWAAATPQGLIRMTIKNELAAEQFRPGEAWDVLLSLNPDQPQR